MPYMRVVQKVRSLTQLTIRYAHHIFSTWSPSTEMHLLQRFSKARIPLLKNTVGEEVVRIHFGWQPAQCFIAIFVKKLND